MKTLALLCLLVVSLHARADLLITQTVDTNGQQDTKTIKIKGDMVRADSPARSSIIDTASGDIITLNNTEKTYTEMTGDQIKAGTAKLQAMMHAGGAPQRSGAQPVDTGTSEKLNGYETEIYTAQTPVSQFTYWVSTDYPNAAALQEQFSKLQTSMQSKLGFAGMFAPDTSKLPGVILKTEMDFSGRTITTTLVSVKDAPIDDADFKIPAGFTEKQIPAGLP